MGGLFSVVALISILPDRPNLCPVVVFVPIDHSETTTGQVIMMVCIVSDNGFVLDPLCAQIPDDIRRWFLAFVVFVGFSHKVI